MHGSSVGAVLHSASSLMVDVSAASGRISGVGSGQSRDQDVVGHPARQRGRQIEPGSRFQNASAPLIGVRASTGSGRRRASDGSPGSDASRHVVGRELLTWFFAAIGSHPHIVATRAAPVEMTFAMPAKRSENQMVLAPAVWTLLANANLIFGAGESPFGHRNDGTIPSSTVAACTLIANRRRSIQGISSNPFSKKRERLHRQLPLIRLEATPAHVVIFMATFVVIAGVGGLVGVIYVWRKFD